MKKIIIALLAVILLVTTVIMCWPMDTKAEATSPWKADGSDTPGHANYDHVTKAEFASSLGIAEGDVNVITNYTEFCAISSGTEGSIKYYLVDLSADDDGVLDLTTASTHLSKSDALSYIYVDFNGYEVNVGGVNNGVFKAFYYATIKNLKMIGERTYVSDRAYYSNKKSVIAQSPLTAQGYNNDSNKNTIKDPSKNGVVHLDNVFSSTNTIVTQQHGYGKEVGGIIAYAGANSTFSRCVNNSNITVRCDKAAIDATAGSSNTVLAAQVGSLGGVVGFVSGKATFEDCINTGNLIIDESQGAVAVDQNGGGGANVAVGGIAGYVNGEASLEGCTNGVEGSNENGNIVGGATAGKCFKHYGGLLGRAIGVISLGYDLDSLSSTPVAGKPCSNYGNITVNGIYNNDHQQPISGMAGSCYGGARAIGCVNYGDITINVSSTKATTEQPLGGIFGIIGGSTMYVENCRNEGNFTDNSATPNNCLGGIVGKLSTDAATNSTFTMKGCTNKGTMTGAIVGGLLGMAEDGSSNIKINNCGNSGSVVVNKIGLKGASYGGGLVGLTIGDTLTIENSTTTSYIEKETEIGAISSTLSNVSEYYLGGFAGLVDDTVNVKNSSNGATVNAPLSNGDNNIYCGGFFGATKTTVTLDTAKNMASIIGKNAGGIVGGIKGDTTITGDTTLKSGNVAAITTPVSGGVVSTADANLTINYVMNSAPITGNNNAGGILAYVLTGSKYTITINNCLNTGAINDPWRAGGIAGYVKGVAVINNCVNGVEGDPTKGTITTKTNSDAWSGTGGILGYAQSGNGITIKGCTNYANVSSPTVKDTSVGGIVGKSIIPTTIGGSGEGEGCLNAGAIEAKTQYVGGIIGYCNNTLSVTNAVNKGAVDLEYTQSGIALDATTANASGEFSIKAGGIVGYISDSMAVTLTDCENRAGVEANGIAKGTLTTNKTADVTAGTATGYKATFTMYVDVGGIIPYANNANLTIDNCNTYGSEARIHAIRTDGLTHVGNYCSVPDVTTAGGFIGRAKVLPIFVGAMTNENITEGGYAGGIIGWAPNGITLNHNFTNLGNVKGVNSAGGIIGYVTGTATIKGCVNGAANAIDGNFVTATSTNTADGIGGIVGYVTADAIIEGCTNYANLYTANDHNKAAKYIGGIIGRAAAGAYLGYKVESATTEARAKGDINYNYGTINSNNIFNNDHTNYVGGMIGEAVTALKVTNCINRGNIEVKNSPTKHTNGAGAHAAGVGGIVGVPCDTTNITVTVTDCSNYGDIYYNGTTANRWGAGGIVGYIFDGSGCTLQISGCYNEGDIYTLTTEKMKYAGGILGYGKGAVTIDDCENKGEIDGLYTGGIMGYANKAMTITNSTNLNGAEITGWKVGGIIGYSNGTLNLTMCHNNGAVTGNKQVGGLCGYSNAKPTVTNCTTGKDSVVTGTGNIDPDGSNYTGYLGGLLGQGIGTPTFSDCTTDGNIVVINWKNVTAGKDSFIGGITGHSNYGSYTKCTNNANITVSDLNQIGGIGGIIGRNNGGKCKFTDCTNNGNITVNASASFLLGSSAWTHGVGGIIGNGGAGGDAETYVRCKNTGEITVYAETAVGGIAGFIGDGKFMPVNCSNSGNITVDKFDLSASTDKGVGGIIGYIITNACDVKSCVNTGNITTRGVFHTGGIVGNARNNTKTITDCENRGTITFSDYSPDDTMTGVSGIIGYAQGGTATITYCINKGEITMPNGSTGFKSYLGGIVGRSANPCNFTITHCVNNGNIKASTVCTGDVSYAGGIMGIHQSWGNPTNNTPEKQVIEDCVNTGSLSAYRTGGIVGYVDVGFNSATEMKGAGLTLRGCINNGTLTAVSYAGGMVGANNYSNGKGTNNVDISSKVLYVFENCVNLGDLYGNYLGGMTPMAYNVGFTFTGCISAGVLNKKAETYIFAPIHTGSDYHKYTDTVSGCFYTDKAELGAMNEYSDVSQSTKISASELDGLLREGDSLYVIFDRADMEVLYGIAKERNDSKLADAMAEVLKLIDSTTPESGAARPYFETTQEVADEKYLALYELLYPSDFVSTFEIVLPVSVNLEDGMTINVAKLDITPKASVSVKVAQTGIAKGGNFALYMMGDASNVIEFCFKDALGEEIGSEGTLATFGYGGELGNYKFDTVTKVDSDKIGKYKGTLTFTVVYDSGE